MEQILIVDKITHRERKENASAEAEKDKTSFAQTKDRNYHHRRNDYNRGTIQYLVSRTEDSAIKHWVTEHHATEHHKTNQTPPQIASQQSGERLITKQI